MDARSQLIRLFDAAVAAVSPARAVPPCLPEPPKGRTVVIGAGKAAAAMARAVEDHWQASLEGLVVTRYGHGVPTRRLRVVEAAHPIPDNAGSQAAAAMVSCLAGLTADDLVLCLLSGGGSALLAAPLPGLELEDKRRLTAALLRSGADITAINCVRKHLSALKGGRLAALAAPARVVTIALSDVAGDDPSTIASGPTVGDPTTQADARAELARHGITPSPVVAAVLNDPAFETPKPDDPLFAACDYRLAATPAMALEAAARVARENGFAPLVLGDALEGEAREMAKVMAGIARSVRVRGHPVAAPAVILSGGEATVSVRGRGKGGPNAEFALALALALRGEGGIAALACDSDGIDGTEDNAGAVITPDTLARAGSLGLDPAAFLADNDAYGFFRALGDLVVTGPTRTNVNDIRAILVE